MPTFNVLTDRWIPLETRTLIGCKPDNPDDLTAYASYIELMSGERDALDLCHPRDDIKMFSRTLLAALTQALLGAADIEALRDRIENPLDRKELEEALAEYLPGFEAVGGPAFMQGGSTPKSNVKSQEPDEGDEEGAGIAALLFGIPKGSNANLFRGGPVPTAICEPCFVPALYGCQSYAYSAGRGSFPSVVGSPPVLTMVLSPKGVRASTWCNVLADTNVKGRQKQTKPWLGKHAANIGDGPIGLIDGLFWQPRQLASQRVGAGLCVLCGCINQHMVSLVSSDKKSQAGKREFRHPLVPTRELFKKGQPAGLRTFQFRSGRPVFASLPDLLNAPYSIAANEKAISRRAPVISQALECIEAPSFAVFQYLFDKASLLGMFSAQFPLSRSLVTEEALACLRGAVENTETAVYLLDKSLKAAGNEALSPNIQDAKDILWGDTEADFWTYVDGLKNGRADLDCFRRSLRSRTLGLFDKHTSSIGAERMQTLVKARVRLQADLKRELPLTTEPRPEEKTTKKQKSLKKGDHAQPR
jgi:CRISPR type I-E-associated protein CasA/Cse1